jgi:hypothetical protein
LSEASFAAPGYFEQRRISAKGGQVIGCLFFRRFAAGSFSLGKLSIVGRFVCRQRNEQLKEV